MKYAIISDVHANPAALLAVLADAEREGAGRVISLGDATGYGYDAVGAVKLLRERTMVHLLGNHDECCAADEQTAAMKACPNYDIDRMHRRMLPPEAIRWLRSRPLVYARRGFACAHGDFDDPGEFNYIMTGEDAFRSFDACDRKVLFVGHTHSAVVVAMDPKGKLHVSGPKSFALKKGWRYLVNAGSVGYPRNDYESIYFIYDGRARKVICRKLEFDFAGYVGHLLDAGMPIPGWLAELIKAARSYLAKD